MADKEKERRRNRNEKRKKKIFIIMETEGQGNKEGMNKRKEGKNWKEAKKKEDIN